MSAAVWLVWWAWLILGFAIGVIEIALPGGIFLGIGLGAILTGLTMYFGLWSGAGLGLLIVVFAVFSMICAWVLRRVLYRPGRLETWERDANGED